MRLGLVLAVGVLVFAAVAFSASLNPRNDQTVIEIPLEQRFIDGDVLRARQSARLAKLGKSIHQLSEHDINVLLEAPFITDYISATINFGTPLQTFNVTLSTGATRAWVFGSNYEAKVKNQQVYNPNDSSTAKNSNSVFNDVDGSYNVSGTWYTDVMQFEKFTKARVKGQAFGVIEKVVESGTGEDISDPYPLDGLMGLNHLIPSAYECGEPAAPIDNILAKGGMKLVSIWLDAATDPDKGPAKGLVKIGAYDDLHCDGDSSLYLPLAESRAGNQFVIDVSSTYYGNYKYPNPGQALIDSGVSTIMLPAENANVIYADLQPEYSYEIGAYTVKCDERINMPDFKINSHGYSFQVTPQEYAFEVKHLKLKEGICVLALISMPEHYSTVDYVFGTAFLRNRCTIFKFDEQFLILEDTK